MLWWPGESWTSGNYVWKFEYLVTNDDHDYTTGSPTTISVDVTPSNATDRIQSVFSSAIDIGPDQVLHGHFYRDVASDNGDDTGDAEFGVFKYTKNKLGEAY